MTTDIELRLRDHFADLADEVQIPEMTFEDLLVERTERVHRSRLSTGRPERARSIRSWMLAAASVVLVLAGLSALASRRDSVNTDERSTPVEPTKQTPLSSVDDVMASDWIIATSLPEDRQWLYALAATDGLSGDAAMGRQVSYRVVWYGTERKTEQLGISIDASSPVPEGEAVEVAGTTWTVSAWTPGQWTAARQLASSTVTVSDRGVFDAADRDLLAGLVVVPESGLPSPPLGDPDRAVAVARFDLDGVTHTLTVQESNGFWCDWVGSEQGNAGGCGHVLDPNSVITIDGGSTTTSEGSDVVEVERGGSVLADVARVEVEFGGGVISVVPTDESGQFDRKFWIVAARFDAPAEAGRPSPAALIEVRAYDSQDRLLATQTPPYTGL